MQPNPLPHRLPDTAPLELRVRDGSGEIVVEAEGELDLSTAEQLHSAVLDQGDSRGEVIIDLRKVSFIDSSGIAALIRAFKSRDGAGPMSVVISPDGQVARVIELVGLGEVLPIVRR